MGVYVNTTRLGSDGCILHLEACVNGLRNVYDALCGCRFPSDAEYQAAFQTSVQLINQKIEDMIEKINQDKVRVWAVINQFDSAEARNNQIASSFAQGVNVSVGGSSYRGSSRNANVPTTNADTELQSDNNIQAEAPNQIEEVDKEEVDITLDGKVPATQVERVIELIYGENTTLSDDEKQRIAEAILKINNTQILEGLDESIANAIRADIVEDYLEGKIELEGITKEELQEYIESQPSINIKFELNESISNFEDLIANGYLTEGKINSVVENSVQICTGEDFEKIYEEFSNTETGTTDIEIFYNTEKPDEDFADTKTEIANVEFFYNKKDNKVYIKDTSNSVTITKAIISVLGENIIFNSETGQVSYVTSPENADISMNPDENIVLNKDDNKE